MNKNFTSWRSVIGLILITNAVLMMVYGFVHYRNSADADTAIETVANQSAPSGVASEPREASPQEALKSDRATGLSKSKARSSANSGHIENSAAAKELMKKLTELSFEKGVMTAEQAKNWKQALADLQVEGAAAVPAIREFLLKNVDINFAVIRGGYLTGEPSARTALIKTLEQIGGPEAKELLVETMSTTAAPSEIALVANYLEQQAPGQYREQALKAAGEVFTLASEGQLPGFDVAPLIQMQRNFDMSMVKTTAEKLSDQYACYAAMALADAEGGTGLPSILRLIDNSAEGNSRTPDFAFQMLAQIAAQVPDAASALMQRVRAGQIPEAAWQKIAAGLGGDQYGMFTFSPDGQTEVPNAPGLKTYHVELGNQNFYSIPISSIASPEQLELRRRLIDQLLAAKPGPAAVQALQQARTGLTGPVASNP